MAEETPEQKHRLIGCNIIRCAEYEERQYYLVPIEWTDEQIATAIDASVAAYIDAIKNFNVKEVPVVGPMFERFIDSIPAEYHNLTISEYMELSKKRVAEFAEASKIRQANEHIKFKNFLKEQGILTEQDFFDVTERDGFEADFGHHHGLHLKY